MKKYVMIFISLLLLTVIIQDVSATDVFLTCDNINGEDNDLRMLNSIKEYIEEYSGNEITVIVDSQAPGPGEGTRAILSNCDVAVSFAASCSGNYVILAKAASSSSKQFIYVNTGDVDLDNTDFIRRAWDDNYSDAYFAGLNNPGTFLNDAGIEYIQPSKDAAGMSDDEKYQFIAKEIVNKINSNQNNIKSYDTGLIVEHQMNPSVLATASHEIRSTNSMNDTYNSYTAPQVLYMASGYLNGSSLSQPGQYEQPSNPLEYSLFARGSYSFYDYMKMGTLIREYMDENGKAPDYINYEGAYIGYYDLVNNYAKITENHTSYDEMDFASEYNFEKVNQSILIDFAPFLIGALLLLIFIGIIRRIIRR